jgi:hypothetical protein
MEAFELAMTWDINANLENIVRSYESLIPNSQLVDRYPTAVKAAVGTKEPDRPALDPEVQRSP